MTLRRAAGVWALALGVAAGAAAIVFAAERDRSPWPVAVLAIAIGLGFILCGLIAAVRRPRNRTGLLMTAVGFTWFLGALTE